MLTAFDEFNMKFDDGKWKQVYTLSSYVYVGIAHLSPPRQARYLAVRRDGFINLKEVEVYQRASK